MMPSSMYVTDSPIVEHGHGGGVVSFHELTALQGVSIVKHVYQHVGRLLVQEAYPRNPFMYDYYIASLLKPDEIDIAQFYGAGFTLTMKRLQKAKIVATVAAHDLDVSLEEWNSFQIFDPPPPHLTDPNLFDLLCRGLTEETDIIVCPSKSSAEFLVRKLHVEKPKVIPHGTDLPEMWSSEREPFTVSHVGQFGPDKGQKYLIEAWRMLSLRGELVFAGNPYIKTLTHGVPNIRCSGYISEEEKNQLYMKSSVYVQSSVTEGFGLCVLDAMSYGTPVIVTEGVGAKDCIEDGKDGFIVPIRDSRAIAEKISYLHNNPSEVKRMGQNARAKAERYSWSIIESEYQKLLETLV